MQEIKPVKKPTVLQSFIIGSMAGAAEVLVNHPLWTIKIRIQCGDPFTLNPRILYRSVFHSALSFIPSAALQVGLNRFFQKTILDDQKVLSKAEQIFSAFSAGAVAAIIRCPTELIMTQQRITNRNFYLTSTYIIKNQGIKALYIGFSAIVIRSGTFAVSFLAARPILKDRLVSYDTREPVASVGAGLLAGTASAVITQAFDTINAYQQSNAHHKSINMLQACKNICEQKGFLALFKGGLPRALRVASAANVMGLVNENMNNYFSKP